MSVKKAYFCGKFSLMQEMILILDFGSQVTQLIGRRLRELNVYCEIHPFNKIPVIGENVKGVILSGSPFSVRDEKEAQIMVDTLRPLSDLMSPAAAPGGGAVAESGAPAAPQAEPAPAPVPAGPAAPSITPPSPAPGKKLWIRVPSEEDPVLKRIGLILTMFPGQDSLNIWCEKEKKRLGTRCLLHEGLLLELNELLGAENVVLK